MALPSGLTVAGLAVTALWSILQIKSMRKELKEARKAKSMTEYAEFEKLQFQSLLRVGS